mgnify:CR=1 FL=1
MAQFYPLTVTDVRRETRDSVVVTLDPKEEHKAFFKFIQGQYLTFRATLDGEARRLERARRAHRAVGRVGS